MLATAWRRRRQYSVAQIDVFSGPAFIWAELVCRLLRALGKPYVLSLHGGGLPAFAQKWPARVLRLLGSANAVTTPSRYLQAEMERYRRGIIVLRNGLDLSAYHYRRRERCAPNLLWLRGFHRVYDPELAPEVLARIVEEFPTATLTMVGADLGDGSLNRTLDGAEKAGVALRLTCPGAVTKSAVPAWLAKHDVFLNTARVDNAPVSVVEALASGLCVVSTDPGGIPYMLAHEQNALLAPVGDATALATQVIRILRHPDLTARLSQGGRSTAELFDWATIIPQWEELLLRVATGRTEREP
jgi:glycosyltransferase involved in cell wall biosynthesis